MFAPHPISFCSQRLSGRDLPSSCGHLLDCACANVDRTAGNRRLRSLVGNCASVAGHSAAAGIGTVRPVSALVGALTRWLSTVLVRSPAAERQSPCSCRCRDHGEELELRCPNTARPPAGPRVALSAIVRHPIYLALLLYLLSICRRAWDIWPQLLVRHAALPHAGTAIRIRDEEKLLRAQFGDEHARYVRERPRPHSATRLRSNA